MATKATTIQFRVRGNELAELKAKFAKMSKDAQVDLRQEAVRIAERVATRIGFASASSIYPSQAQLERNSIRVNKDRIPSITIGGTATARVARKATPGNPKPKVGELLFGNEFGAYLDGPNNAFPNGGHRFPARSAPQGRGSRGYWIFPTLRQAQPEITRDYHNAVDHILNSWSHTP